MRPEAFRLGPSSYLEAQTTRGFGDVTDLTVLGWAHALPSGNPYGAVLCVGTSASSIAGGLCIERAYRSLRVRIDTVNDIPVFDLAPDGDPWAGSVYHFFAVTIANGKQGIGEVGLFWEGAPKTQKSTEMPPRLVATPSPILRLGGSIPVTEPDIFNGLLDNVAIFSRVLTDAEVGVIRANGVACP